jgi:trehalose 6-phosphate phosphatase
MTHVSAPLPPPPLPAAGERWALFLDVDGTLLGFADRPEDVSVSPALRRLLGELHEALDGALALVSGRSTVDLAALFGSPPWAMAGLHGLELRHADGSRRELATDAPELARLRREAQALAERLPGVRLEDKGLAVALHSRRAPAQFQAMAAGAEALAEGLVHYALQPGDMVMEFKPAGVDKGQAVSELLEREPFAGRTPVYLGDDLTDEHAFAVANLGNGVSVRVGSREPTLAQFTLAEPAAVHAWLARVRDAIMQKEPKPHAQPTGGPRTHF